MRIDSLKDPLMKRIRLLSRPVGRRQLDRYVVEGERLCRRALEQGVAEVVVVSGTSADIRALAAEKKVPVVEVGVGLLSRAMTVRVPPKVIAVVPGRLTGWREVLGKRGLVVMTEGIQSVDNLGMLLRSAEGAGVAGVLLAGDSADPLSRRAIRAARGAHFSLPLARHDDPAEVLAAARAAGFRIIATSARDGKPYTAADYRGPVLLVAGNESTGISPVVRAAADAVVSIPMAGRLDCLNLTVAASVVMYEAVRQRGVVAG